MDTTETTGTTYSFEPTTTTTATETETLRKEFFTLKNILSGLMFEIELKKRNQTELMTRMLEINDRLNQIETETKTEAYHEKN